MAKTPYSDLGSTDILSAHISGLQHSVNKIEEILNMNTATVTDLTLNAVADQDDPSMRYKIYEGSIRNWLSSPAPVIKRDGVPVPTSEYTIFPAYGVVVFNTQQAATAVIKADVTYVTNTSAVISDILSDISRLQSPFPAMSGVYESSNIGAGRAASVTVAAGSADVFPFVVRKTTTYSAMAVRVDAAAGTGARLAIYNDNGSAYPGSLVLDAGTVDTTTTGWKEVAINQTLQPGLYWLARNSDGGVSLGGFNADSMLPIPFKRSIPVNGTPDGPVAAYRITMTYGAFPNPFPSGASYLARDAYAPVFMKRA